MKFGAPVKIIGMLAVLLLIFSTTQAMALASKLDDIADDDLDLVLDGFELKGAENEIDRSIDFIENSSDLLGGELTQRHDNAPEWLRIGGSLAVASAVSLCSHEAPPDQIDLQGLSKFRTELDLTADVEIKEGWRARLSGQTYYDWAYAVRGRQNFTDQMLEAYENELELGEAWLEGSLVAGLDVKFGRQIVVWGKSDNIRVTDVLNPLDNREPGMTDIEDLRLPTTMTRLDYILGNWIITGLVVHEIRFGKFPVYGSDYYSASRCLPAEVTPPFGLESQEYGLALSSNFNGWDMALYGAYIYDDDSHLAKTNDGVLERRHSRITMLGASVNMVRGDWLLKAETAWFWGMEYASLPGEKKSRLDALAGVEYSGFTDTSMSIEAVNRHIFGYKDCMASAEDNALENRFQWAVRVSRKFMHERLEAVILAYAFDVAGQGGSMERFELTYDIADQWEITGGLVLYQSGDWPAYKAMGEDDRLFLDLKYDF